MSQARAYTTSSTIPRAPPINDPSKMKDGVPWENYGVNHNDADGVLLEDSFPRTKQDSNNGLSNYNIPMDGNDEYAAIITTTRKNETFYFALAVIGWCVITGITTRNNADHRNGGIILKYGIQWRDHNSSRLEDGNPWANNGVPICVQ